MILLDVIFGSKSLLKDRGSQLKDMENLSYTQNTSLLANSEIKCPAQNILQPNSSSYDRECDFCGCLNDKQ